MAIIYTADVCCDHRPEPTDPVCGEWTFGATRRNSTPTRAQARDHAAESGWARRYGPSSFGYDLCPDHASQVPGETFADWKVLP